MLNAHLKIIEVIFTFIPTSILIGFGADIAIRAAIATIPDREVLV